MTVFGWIETIYQTYAATQRLEKRMATLQDDLNALKAAVADVATDVADVASTLKTLRDELANAGATPEQLQTLEDAVSGLQVAHQGLRDAVGGSAGTAGRKA